MFRTKMFLKWFSGIYLRLYCKITTTAVVDIYCIRAVQFRGPCTTRASGLFDALIDSVFWMRKAWVKRARESDAVVIAPMSAADRLNTQKGVDVQAL